MKYGMAHFHSDYKLHSYWEITTFEYDGLMTEDIVSSIIELDFSAISNVKYETFGTEEVLRGYANASAAKSDCAVFVDISGRDYLLEDPMDNLRGYIEENEIGIYREKVLEKINE